MNPFLAPHRRPSDLPLLVFCILCLGVTVFYPTVRLSLAAIFTGDWSEPFTGAGLEALRNTVVICFLSVLTAGILGTALAFLVTRYRFPGHRVLSGVAFLPFALPPLVGTLSFYFLLGDGGLIPRLIQQVIGGEEPILRGPIGILVIHTYSFYVFFYAMVAAALEGMDTSQIEAARTLGANRWRVFWKVTGPMLRPALLGAALLTFMTSGASFSAPYYFGGDFPYLSVRIFRVRNELFDEGAALTLTVVLACVSLLGVLIFRSRREVETGGTKGTPRVVKSQSGRFLIGAGAWALVMLLLTPHFVIAWLSFVDHAQWINQLIPRPFTLENYERIFSDTAALRPLRNSLWMSAVAAIATLAVGLPAAYIIGRRRVGKHWVNLLVMIPWALPGTVIAMNLIAAFNDCWLPIYGTVWIVPMAYFVRNIPLLTRMVSASVAQFDGSLMEAGRTLGGSRWFCFRHVVVPLMMPALVASTVLVFASSLGEFVASILLYTPQNIPIAVQIDTQWRGSGIGSAFAYSVLLMIMVTATFLISRRFASRII